MDNKAEKVSTLTLATGLPSNARSASAAVVNPDRASRSPPRSVAQQGFSLLEIMVVVVIIGILVSIFTLSVGSFAETENTETVRRLEALLELASEEAAIQGREIGLHFYQHGYEFSARVPVTDKEGLEQWRWVPLDEDRLLKPRSLDEDYVIELEIDGKEAELEYQRTEPTEDKPYEPQIFLLSSGEITPPFNATIRQSFNDEFLMLSVSAEGNIEIKADDI